MRRTQAERTRFGFTGDVFPYLVEKFLVGVTFVAADVDYECAAVGYYIVLCPCIHHGYTHFTGPNKADSFGKR